MNLSKVSAKEKKEFVAGIMEVAKRVPRFNFNGFHYLTLAKEALEKHNKSKSELQSIGEKDKNVSERFRLKQEMKKNQIIVITFSGMFLESAIWDYGASKKTEICSSAKKFRKLNWSLGKKWEKIIQSVSGKEMPKDAIESLEKLVKARNEIVHSKSEPAPKTYDELLVKMRKEEMSVISADKAFQCIAECLNGLQKIDSKWWLFDELTGNALSGHILLPGFRIIREK